MSDVNGISAHDLSDYFGADELDPELAEYLAEDEHGNVHLRHPLVYSMFHHSMLNRAVNRSLESKRACLAEYYAEHNWRGIILAHERPYRLDALLEVASNVTDAEWWELVAYVWMDSENIRQNPDEWDAILRSDRPERHAMMDEADHAAFDMLPAVIAVYQGCTDERDDGWSWSTDPHKAKWFADRFAMMESAEPRLRSALVDKSDVTAYLTDRGESEILVAPEFVREL